jgi:hypothetical protein
MKRLTHHHSPSHHLRGLTNMIDKAVVLPEWAQDTLIGLFRGIAIGAAALVLITLTGCAVFRYGGPGGEQVIGRAEEPTPDVGWLKEAKRGEASNEQANGRGSALGAKGISRSGGNVESVQRSDDADRGRSKGDGRISASTPQRSGEEVKEWRITIKFGIPDGEERAYFTWTDVCRESHDWVIASGLDWQGCSFGGVSSKEVKEATDAHVQRDVLPNVRRSLHMAKEAWRSSDADRSRGLPSSRMLASRPTPVAVRADVPGSVAGNEVTDAELASSHIDGRFAPTGVRTASGFILVKGRIGIAEIPIHGNGLRLDVSETERLFGRHQVGDATVRRIGRQRIVDMIVERGR